MASFSTLLLKQFTHLIFYGQQAKLKFVVALTEYS